MSHHVAVDHQSFDMSMAAVRSGSAQFVIWVNAHKSIVVDRKVIERFERAKTRVLWKDEEGSGFRLRNGRSIVYVIPGYLRLVKGEES